MKKTAVIVVMATLMASGIGYAQEAPKVPDVLTIKGIRLPQDRITLQNGVVAVVTQVTVPQAGKWHFSGNIAVQDSVFSADGHYLGNRGLETRFLYTFGGFSKNDPHNIDYDKGLATLDSRPYGTWWFPANPPGTDFRCQAGDVVYMLVESYGGAPPDLSQAFGSFEGELLVGN